MIAHGHSDVNYAHYVLDMYPSDANFTVTSIMKLLCQLEEQPVCSSRQIPISSIGNPLHDALVVGVEKCSGALPLAPIEFIPRTKLPPLLLVQMDNCAKDNKSKYNMLFWSLVLLTLKILTSNREEQKIPNIVARISNHIHESKKNSPKSDIRDNNHGKQQKLAI